MAQRFKTTPTTASQVIAGRENDMTKNLAGGYAFKADAWTQLERFLILGTAGGTYYATEQKLNNMFLPTIEQLVAKDGVRVVQMVADVRSKNRAYRQDATLYVLAVALAKGDADTRVDVAKVFNDVIKTGTQLFTFVSYVNDMRGWGETLRRPIANWYNARNGMNLAYQITKYASREGWTHRDVLRKAHVQAVDPTRNAVLAFAANKLPADIDKRDGEEWAYIRAVLRVKAIASEIVGKVSPKQEKEIISLISKHGLPQEVVPTEVRTVAVWDALLGYMKPIAMLRNLGVLTSRKVLTPLSESTTLVVNTLNDREALRKAKVHPMQVFAALITYAQGHGMRGDLHWTPITAIIDALTDAFYATFDTVQPTGKRLMLGIDISGSMQTQTVNGIFGLTAAEAVAALALVVTNTEKSCMIQGYNTCAVALNISPRQRLDDVAKYICNTASGGTNCSVPIQYALEHKLEVDAFLIFTDGENHGDVALHVCEALKQYRKEMGINAKCVLLSAAATRTTLADPQDAGMLDIVGFTPDAPAIALDFLADRLS